MELIEIVTTLTTLSVIASAICAATPTPKDDAFFAKWIYPVVEALALNIGKAKE
jgi:hypothetical protein